MCILMTFRNVFIPVPLKITAFAYGSPELYLSCIKKKLGALRLGRGAMPPYTPG